MAWGTPVPAVGTTQSAAVGGTDDDRGTGQGSGSAVDPPPVSRSSGKGACVENLSRDQIHQRLSVGTAVVAENGERLGRVRTIHPHYILVAEAGETGKDLEVPIHALSNYDGETLRITVNREALTVVDHEEEAARLENEGGA